MKQFMNRYVLTHFKTKNYQFNDITILKNKRT